MSIPPRALVFTVPVNSNGSDSENEENSGPFKLPAHLRARLNKRDRERKTQTKRERSPLGLSSNRVVLNNVTNTPPELDRRQTIVIRKNKAIFSVVADKPELVYNNNTISKNEQRALIEEADNQYKKFINSVIATSFKLEDSKFDPTKIISESLVTAPESLTRPTASTSVPLKDGVSSEAYKEVSAMDRLRKNAKDLYHSDYIKTVQEMLIVEMKQIKRFYIRKDKSLLDVGMKKHILSIFVNYNLLWLKVAVETVFGVLIEKSSASAVIQALTQNLVNFNKMASDKGYRNVTTFFMKEKNLEIARFHVLYHFLMLVHFMDVAKKRRLIDHDPCLYRTDIPYDKKSSRESAVEFASNYVTGVGNIIAALANVGIHLEHTQKPIEEFNFVVTNLGQDLLCGVRLARLVEIILQRNDILPKLLYPPNSITRKLHNMEVVLKVLKPHLPHIELSSKELVHGNRCKIIPLLDELIKLHEQRQCLIELASQENKVVIIQRWWRRHLSVRADRNQFLTLKIAVLIIQKHWCSYLLVRKARLEFQMLRKAVIVVQHRWRANKLAGLERAKFLRIRKAIFMLQKLARAYIIKKRICREISQKRAQLLERKKAVEKIDIWWQSILLMRKDRQIYLQIKRAVLTIEQSFQLYKERSYYLNLKHSALYVQRKWRASRAMKCARQVYLEKKDATEKIQIWWRSISLMRQDRQAFLRIKRAVVNIERSYIFYKERSYYRQLKLTSLFVQRKWRANQAMKVQRKAFLKKKDATEKIQTWWRSISLMRKDRQAFLRIKRAVVNIERSYIFYKERSYYRQLKLTSLFVQRKWRANQAMKIQRKAFLEKKEAATKIQNWSRSIVSMKKDRKIYLKMKRAVVTVERGYLLYKERSHYLHLKQSILYVQRKWRANQAMKRTRQAYQGKKQATMKIQIQWRAIQAGRSVRLEMAHQKEAAVTIQRWWRSVLLTKRVQAEHLAKREAALKIQQWFKVHRMGRLIQQEYLSKRNAAIVLQRHYREKRRGNRLRKIVVNYVAFCKNAATNIQRIYRGWMIRRAMGPVLEEKRRAIALAAERATEDKKIINIVLKILERIRRATRIDILTHDLKKLQSYTNNSNEICWVLITDNQVISVLVNFLGSTNRSEPHKLTINYILLIFQSIIARTSDAVEILFANEEFLNLLLNFLRIFPRSPNIIQPTLQVLKSYIETESNALQNDTLVKSVQTICLKYRPTAKSVTTGRPLTPLQETILSLEQLVENI